MSRLLGGLTTVARVIAVEFKIYWRRTLITFVAGAAVLLLIRIPVVADSIIGEPDRDMLGNAFKIRTDVIVGKGDPVLLLDIDDNTLKDQQYQPLPNGWEPNASAPRALLADLLEYVRTAPPQQVPRAVVLDVDIGAPAPGDDAGVDKLKTTLANWAKTPTAPTLVIARESFPPAVLGLGGTVLALPNSAFDDVVDHAPNIYWSTVKVLADASGVVHEFLPFQCVQHNGKVEPLYSAALLAYGAMAGSKIGPASPAKAWIDQAPEHCVKTPTEPIEHGEQINFHMSLGHELEGRAWPNLHTDWWGFKICGRDGDSTVFRRLSASDVIAAAGADASHDLLCQRLVVIGGTNQVADDFQQTPLHQMAGSMILINAIRGLQITNGGMRQASLPLQLAVLFVVSVAITAGFSFSKRARHRYHRYKSSASHWVHRVALLPLNPVVLNWIVAFAAHWVGVALLLVSLNFGYWGFLSAPAFGSAAAEAIQDFTDDDEPNTSDRSGTNGKHA